jgi:type I restriction enzyme M protein
LINIVTLQEIKDNDYNLNIPRYVDTFEEEEPININTVAEEIKALDLEIAETDKRIESYCEELNIKTPF